MAGVMKRREIKGDNLTAWQERHNMLLYHENHIRKELRTIRESFIYIGYHLLDISEKRLYETAHNDRGEYCKDVFQYAFQELDINRSTVYNLMAIAREFSDDRRGLKAEYSDYSYSQLVELLPMPTEARRLVSPFMTVQKIRALKRGEKVLYTDESSIVCESELPPEMLATFQTSGKTESETPENKRDCEGELPGQTEIFQTSGKSDEGISFGNGMLTVELPAVPQRGETAVEIIMAVKERLENLWLNTVTAFNNSPSDELRYVSNEIASILRLVPAEINA